jgi:rubrerythrin
MAEIKPKDQVKLIGWACPSCGFLIREKILWSSELPCPKCQRHPLAELKAVTKDMAQ